MAKMLVIAVNANRIVEVDADCFTEFAMKVVGGWTEGVPLSSVVMVCNELGKLEGLPLNRAATDLFWSLGGSRDDYLCGDVVVCGMPCNDETVTGLTARQIEELTEQLRPVGADQVR